MDGALAGWLAGWPTANEVKEAWTVLSDDIQRFSLSPGTRGLCKPPFMDAD